MPCIPNSYRIIENHVNNSVEFHVFNRDNFVGSYKTYDLAICGVKAHIATENVKGVFGLILFIAAALYLYNICA